MDFQIRLSKPEDLEKILELQASSLRTLTSSYDSSQIESLIRSQASARLAKDEIGVVAEYENEIIGFASVLIQQSLIGGVYVHPDFMRQRLGTQLLEAVEEIALDKRHKVIYVTSSLAAVNFYQARGYKSICKSGFYSESKYWIPCVNLKKQLIIFTETEKWYRHFIFNLKQIFSFILILVIAAFVTIVLPLIISLIASLLQ
ncbi:GNAT family N-acetyltransferase [Calothrix sp. PCC 7507]|uniref:GNAT family N-acetyltransferase n=1 Tax=Calothrix sp. PCC 7507 TaxID=99598 RepID=UPI00029F2A6B|nr:GNAT family N-acetyltransferase [Calothrix sp. PCC 7507]AFY31556.1 GCN5-related N-acetyltransferase [Calothrix sp. PCC 7507]